MAAKVFLCYRRDDTAGYALHLQAALKREFGGKVLFMDVEDIRPGFEFDKVLSNEVEKCEVLLALIGPNWINAQYENGKRRLDDPSDFVRIEIGTALRRNIPVIPSC